MTFLAPHFDPDVFVSYSHGNSDASVEASDLKVWTHKFVGRLQSSIRSYEDEDIKELRVWFDRDLDETAHLTDAIKDKVTRSGLLLIIMSKRYLSPRSVWCRDELNWFCEALKKHPGYPGRVFVVQAQETDRSEWPEVLRDERGHGMVGFPFFDPEDRRFPIGSSNLESLGSEFGRAVQQFHVKLILRLRQIRDRVDSSAAPAPALVAPNGARRIYLHVPSDAEALQPDIETALSGEGLKPLFGRAPSGDMQRDAKILREQAKRCCALVLLRTADSEGFDADFWDIGVDERERIAAARGAPLPCAVLDRTGAALGYDLADWGVVRFDLKREGWRHDFLAWLDGAVK